MDKRSEPTEALPEVEVLVDPLTGVADRGSFARAVEATLADRGASDRDVVIVFCELDNLDEIHMAFGASGRDEVLRMSASRLQATVRGGDLVGRWGDDEFAVLCSGDPTDDDIAMLAGRIGGILNEPVPLPGKDVRVPVSVGTARTRADEVGDVGLVEADRSVYEAKRRARLH